MKTSATRMKRFSFLAFALFALAARTAWAQPSNPANWSVLSEGGAVVELAPDTVSPLPGDQTTNTLRITIKKIGERFGAVCPEMGNLKLESGDWCDLSFNARTDPPKTFALIVSLESPDGRKVFARTTLPEVGGDQWGRFSVALHVRAPASRCRLVIALADTGTIWLNDVSLVRRDGAGVR